MLNKPDAFWVLAVRGPSAALTDGFATFDQALLWAKQQAETDGTRRFEILQSRASVSAEYAAPKIAIDVRS